MQKPRSPANNPDANSPKRTNLARSISKLAAQIRHNQRRIAQLQQRNTQLTHKIQQMSRKPPSPTKPPRPTPATGSRLPRDRQPKSTFNRRLLLSTLFLCACVAILCGSIAFTLVKLLRGV